MIPIFVEAAKEKWPSKYKHPDFRISRFILQELGFINISSTNTTLAPGDLLFPKIGVDPIHTKKLGEMIFLTLKSPGVEMGMFASTVFHADGFRAYRHAWSPSLRHALICKHKHLTAGLLNWIEKTPYTPIPVFPRFMKDRPLAKAQTLGAFGEVEQSDEDEDEDHEASLDDYKITRISSPGNINFSRGLPLP